MRALLLPLVPAGVAWAGMVGPEACRPCHRGEYETQSRSRHSRALRPILESPLPALLAGVSIRERSGVAFEYRPGKDALIAIVNQGTARGTAQLAVNLEWAFGAGAQAYTPVGRRGGRYFEHRVSYYTSASRPGRTLGHPGEPSRSLESAIGIPQDAVTISRCFDCHATGVRPGPDLGTMRPGVTCDRCHGDVGAHLARTGPMADPIAALSRLDAAASVEFCAQCHRSAPASDDAFTIRFQPVGLMASRCFRQSGRLSCVTCHNPHEDARHDPDFYVAKCLGCHASGEGRPGCGRAERRDCLPCHMQRRSPAEFKTRSTASSPR